MNSLNDQMDTAEHQDYLFVPHILLPFQNLLPHNAIYHHIAFLSDYMELPLGPQKTPYYLYHIRSRDSGCRLCPLEALLLISKKCKDHAMQFIHIFSFHSFSFYFFIFFLLKVKGHTVNLINYENSHPSTL